MNINKYVVLVAVLSIVGDGFAEEAKPDALKKPKMTLSQAIQRKEGGFLKDMRRQKGCIKLVNAQTVVSDEVVRSSIVKFERDSKFCFAESTGSFDIKTAKKTGEATVFVIADGALPTTLVAADDGWGAVNVSRLKSDKAAFTEARVRKAIVRVVGFLIGAADSQYDFCLTGKITCSEDYDQIPSEQLPMDVMMRFRYASPRLGLTPWSRTTYKKACEQGWACAPTNEFQKAIWDKVHEIPKNPMKIEFDPKKGR